MPRCAPMCAYRSDRPWGANASTSPDRTNYFETVPAEYLETMLWTHRERMALPVIDDHVFESDGAVRFVFRLQEGPALSGGVTFDVATEDLTAKAGQDYEATVLTGVTIPEGEHEVVVDVPLIEDDVVEGYEYFRLRVDNVQGATYTAGANPQGAIRNDPLVYQQPSLRFNWYQVVEGNFGSQVMRFRLVLDRPHDLPVTFDLATTTDHVAPTHKLRCGPAQRFAGGGGINVARVLHRLGADVCAWALAGGAAGTGRVSSRLSARTRSCSWVNGRLKNARVLPNTSCTMLHCVGAGSTCRLWVSTRCTTPVRGRRWAMCWAFCTAGL